jgi:hypothetical protein
VVSAATASADDEEVHLAVAQVALEDRVESGKQRGEQRRQRAPAEIRLPREQRRPHRPKNRSDGGDEPENQHQIGR